MKTKNIKEKKDKKNNKQIIIGVSGGKGSFSEEAAIFYAQKFNIENFKIKYLINAENVLKNLDKGKINLGIFPIENSNGGIVYEAVNAMSKHNFKIERFFEIDVRQNLLVKPNISKKDIKKIASHPQALRQCRMYLKRKWPNVELIEWSDTAEAAKDLSLGKLSSDTAIIAPINCAKLYNLKILEPEIQDLKFNFTTFLAVKKL
ncbi:MAG TPA: prephenate dehydratase domain-containing protein [Candidatus Pacearchaeota archaeon]|mgnify:FL=1|nr:prephenate dehydratase domain-containing protein [Candidatus Pacearchaeota archaeon]HOL90441.1 prephenate dehydratase domain-containing protein [Candidatus Pacearchaeota archaeon]HPO68434.1 prephenate dehydratase domain-containing protein [Candidatus Pacearchaeota archaeon]